MKTKNIFKALALAILMPAMLLNTACNSDIINNENTDGKGFTLPVTVNVTREGDDATKATYNESTGKLSFSEGDKLFVNGWGNGSTVGQFAGILDYVPATGKFSGTIYTDLEYSGTFNNMIDPSYHVVNAVLLPAGYESYGYLSIRGEGYQMEIDQDHNKAIALTKAAGVEQLSYESVNYNIMAPYPGYFALTPFNGILNFTITSLAVSTEVTVSFKYSNQYTMTIAVTTDAAGNATFAVGLPRSFDLSNCSLTVGGNAITLNLPNKNVEAGKIYNITRSAAPALTYPIALGDATSDYVGSVVTTDGNVYATVAAASAASKTAVAVIAYVGTAGSVDASSDTYKGLAVALSDANSGSNCQWAESYANCLSSSQTGDIVTALGFKNGITCTSTLTSDGHGHAAATAAASNNGTTAPTGTSGWFMPSMGQWDLIVQGLATKKAGSAVTTNLTYQTDNPTYKADNLNSVITDAGGTGFKTNSYWASTEQTLVRAWAIYFTDGDATNYAKTVNYYVRSIIAF